MTLEATLAGSDSATFFRAWLSDTLAIAAIAPSGAALAALITSRITEPADWKMAAMTTTVLPLP
ncbi:phospholipid N-methyltransferase [Neorhizobium galegae]|uniref:hypothetical protein n=1 Tax=Neorhizobium galegae TaxID=399 RepID=UPI001AE5AC9A|nr:hypothetical protein [Neorhizobium galegae]MBP2563191.1 phospholipid N-methyltransferase [Neorhizobium galegae]